MGEYFLIVNVDKKQYLDARRFGESIKMSGILFGNHGLAVAWLVCDSKLLGKAYPFGSWCGDRVIIAGDYEPANFHGIETSTQENPDRNLYCLANDEYEDISYKAIAMLCEHNESIAERLVNRAKENNFMLMDLGNTVFLENSGVINDLLNRVMGKEWVKRYKQVCSKYPLRAIKTDS
jgi:hypothetical protein